MTTETYFNTGCRRCPRLAGHLQRVRAEYPDYHARPVPSFGESDAGLLIVGLAPGMHGANATGRPFTGDYAGLLLYETLYTFGFSNQPQSSSAADGLRLRDCRITNAVRCLPPENRPTTEEIRTCNGYLREELTRLGPGAVVLALGLIAHNAILRAFDLRQSHFRFSHGAIHELQAGGLRLIDSYHCSRYNTQTGRLTEAMFHDVFQRARALLADPGHERPCR